jgi:hypothetical protein
VSLPIPGLKRFVSLSVFALDINQLLSNNVYWEKVEK